jgi:ubiquitin thioesterase protein OTUB1
MEEQRPTDEEILQFEREIKNQETSNTPLVSEMMDFSRLEQEYSQGSPIFIEKIVQLNSSSKGMRTVKKDGNCFYRAFGFRFCELVRETKNVEWKPRILEQCSSTKQLLSEIGYDMSILEDFWEPFWDSLTKSDTPLEHWFMTDYTSDTIVCYLRILTAAFLKKHRDMYECFILGEYPSLEAFLAACVEPMNVESDQIHIVAMANAFNISVRVAHLDASNTPMNFHDISPMTDPIPTFSKLSLLYRPGHYDIVYEKE